jgi:hypothetical protein
VSGDQQFQAAKLDDVVGSRMVSTSLAEDCVGLPFEA